MTKPVGSTVTIRPALLSDLETLVAIDAACFPPGIPYSAAEFRYLLRSRGVLTLIAEIGSPPRIAGFTCLGTKPGKNSALRGELITIDILPQFQRQGTGAALYLELERRFRAANGSYIQLHVAVDNEAAQQFYRHFGYRVVVRVPRYYLNRLDAWKMEKSLR